MSSLDAICRPPTAIQRRLLETDIVVQEQRPAPTPLLETVSSLWPGEGPLAWVVNSRTELVFFPEKQPFYLLDTGDRGNRHVHLANKLLGDS